MFLAPKMTNERVWLLYKIVIPVLCFGNSPIVVAPQVYFIFNIIERAAEREVFEEAGVLGRLGRLLGVFEVKTTHSLLKKSIF